MRNDNTMLTNRVGKRLAAHRSKKNLSQEAFAARVGITRGYLSDLERGTREMSLETLAKVCKKTGATTSQLLGF
jgi:transcriptional regulator with XRE-family HTH domain